MASPINVAWLPKELRGYTLEDWTKAGQTPAQQALAAAKTAAATVTSPSGTPQVGPAPRDYSEEWGGVPNTPSVSGTQAEAIQANLANFGSLIDLAAQINAFNLAQQRKQYEASFPNYAQTEGQIAANIAAGTRGELSEGTLRNLSQAAAQRGVLTGQPGGQAGPTRVNMDYLRTLGLTTEQLQQNAINQLAAYNATSPRTALYNPATMMVSPTDMYNAALQQAVWNAAPVPAANQAAALEAAKAGAAAGFGAARAPAYPVGYQTPGTTSSLIDTFNRYAPTAGYAPIQQQTSPGYVNAAPAAYYPPFDYSTVPQSVNPYVSPPALETTTTPTISYDNPTYLPNFDYDIVPPPNPYLEFDWSTIPSSVNPYG